MIRRGIGVQSFVSAGVDADAQAFITAAEITDATQQSAINTLVTDLKTYGIWSKMKAIWPFVGGTSSSHKWNLKDPRDLDAAFRLVFSGGWTHSSTGAKPNGTNGFANTFLFPSSTLQLNSASHGVYSGTNTPSNGAALGAYNLSGNFRITALYLSYLNSNLSASVNDQAGMTVANTNTSGFFISSRTSSSSMFTSIRNNVTTASVASTERTIQNVLIGGITAQNSNSPDPAGYSPWEHRFTFIGDGLSDTEAANLYTAVQAYQTTLSRQIAP